MIRHSVGENDDQLLSTSGFVAACPKLMELTIFLPHPYDAQDMKEIENDPAGKTRSAISKLVVACKALPDFGTLQIVRFPMFRPCLVCWYALQEHCNHIPPMEQQEQVLEKQTKDLEGWAADCLKKSRTVFQEGGKRKGTTLRVIKFPRGRSVNVKEYEV